MDLSRLPIYEVLPQLTEVLGSAKRAVLVAPPGSGKTTQVAPYLLASQLVGPNEEIWLLQPRRVAARAVARQMAQQLGEPLGQRVGYQVRFEELASAKTRIRVLTEGVLTARLQRDPELKGVGLVILDEFHERSLHADLALALLREVQEVLNPNLHLLVMSATLSAEPVAAFLGCEVVRAQGRSFPIEQRFSESPSPLRLDQDCDERMARAVLDVVREGLDGDVLAFLHGVRPIEQTCERLREPLRRVGVDVLPLHGKLPSEAQDLVLTPGPRPRVVVSTNVAETSLTIPSVTTVIDSGLAKVMRYDLAAGSDRLETTRISKASADQRSGRAGRVGPGRSVRLWTRLEDERLRPFEDPEIQRVDLMGLSLELARWGVDPRRFEFFEPPAMRALEDALQRLEWLGAFERGRLSPLGAQIASAPTKPRLAAWLALTQAPLRKQVALQVAALEAGKVQGELGEGHTRLLSESERRVGTQLQTRITGPGEFERETALLRSHIDRVGVRRGREGLKTRYSLVGGRMAELDGEGPDFLIALELEAGRRGEHQVSLLRAWAPVSGEALEAHEAFSESVELRWDSQQQRVQAAKVGRFLDVSLREKSVPNRERERSGELLAKAASQLLDQVFGGLSEREESLLARFVTFARLYPEASEHLGDEVTRESLLGLALKPMAQGLSSLDELKRKPACSLSEALWQLLPWALQEQLKRALPETLEVPSGSQIKLEYRMHEEPILAAKIQEVFGWQETPRLAQGRLGVVLHLLSPAMRPLQVTCDLASFWTRTWPEVRAEMRSRYPKHFWPEDPRVALASKRTTARRYQDESG